MNTKSARIVGILVSLFAIFYFGYQIYLFYDVPYELETATSYEYTDQIELHGIAIKDEQVIENTYDGIIRYENGNAQKLNTGSVIATVYQSEADLLNSDAVDKLNQNIAILSKLQTQKDFVISNGQSIVSNIKKQQMSMIYQIINNDFIGVSEQKDDFLIQLLRQQMILTPDTNFDEIIASLQSKAAELTAKITIEGTQIISPISGYFTNEVDGYEQIITKELLSDISLEQVQKILNETQPNFSSPKIGKTITTTEWNFLALVPTKDTSRLEAGDTVSLVFPNTSSYKVNAKIQTIDLYPDNEFSVILLSSNIMNEHIINLRVEDPSIVFDTTKALRVPKKAVFMKEITVEVEDESAASEEELSPETTPVPKTQTISQPGVYVSMGQVMKFKKINILDESDNYIICSIETKEDRDDYLQLYDEIILEGTDLYDNKPIR